MAYKIGLIQKRLLILLFGSLSLGLSYSPRQRAKVLAQIEKEWSNAKTESLRKAIRNLYINKMISIKESSDGRITLKLMDRGKEKVLEYKLEDIKIEKPLSWDGRWRLVLFDIPNGKKKIREAFRLHLIRIGFYQYQKSVFIHPYECDNPNDDILSGLLMHNQDSCPNGSGLMKNNTRNNLTDGQTDVATGVSGVFEDGGTTSHDFTVDDYITLGFYELSGNIFSQVSVYNKKIYFSQ